MVHALSLLSRPFRASACGYPSWESRVQAFEQGTLWIHAEKPA